MGWTILQIQSWSVTDWAAVIAVGVAVWTAFVGTVTLNQARRDSKERSRPMVAAELRPVAHMRGALSLVIRNYGPSVATNVRVTFDPPLGDPDPDWGRRSAVPFLKRRYSAPIPVLTPGMELDNIYFYSEILTGGVNKLRNREPTPNRVTVTIGYNSDEGDKYTDQFTLDTAVILDRTYIISPDHPDEQRKAAVNALEGIEEALNGDAARRRRRMETPDEQIAPASHAVLRAW